MRYLSGHEATRVVPEAFMLRFLRSAIMFFTPAAGSVAVTPKLFPNFPLSNT